MSMTRRKRMQYAEKFLVMGHDFQTMGFYRDAAHYFRKSIKMYPTPEAYTYLGWIHSFMGDYTQAIEFCKIAISLDPEYGNAYNDIGAYLMEMGEVDQAIPYLRRAAKARRYDKNHFAHYNLGRAWENKREYSKAVSEYRRALELYPEYEPARMAFYKLVRMMN
ncbi:MAG: tetratricopeptide repeat protein [Candidatus Zixiibacteriota bacterium]